MKTTKMAYILYIKHKTSVRRLVMIYAKVRRYAR